LLILLQRATAFEGSPLNAFVVFFGLLVNFRVIVRIQLGDAKRYSILMARKLVEKSMSIISPDAK